jgi:hypothetical protein
MKRQVLLEQFKDRVKTYERHQLLVERAREYSDSFTDIVVDRVVSDHTDQALAVGSEAVLLYADMEEAMNGLSEERQSVAASQEVPRFSLEELELRLMIGEIDDGAYQNEASQLREFLTETDRRLSDLEGQVVNFQQPMEQWLALSPRSE